MEEETKKKYRDHPIVYKQKIEITIPSLSLVLLSTDDTELDIDKALIAEMVFWNFGFEMLRYHDGRKELNLNSHSLQILRNVVNTLSETKKTQQLSEQHRQPELHEIREEGTASGVNNQEYLGKD